MTSTHLDEHALCAGAALVLCAVCLRWICPACDVQFWVLLGDDPDVLTPVCWDCPWQDLFRSPDA